MIDFHTHILPMMDDGCKKVSESITLLKESLKQGVDSVVLTSHFYPNKENPQSFLDRRSKSLEILKEGIGDNIIPSLYIGAEVAFFRGISRSSDLEQLTILGTDYILIEMPFEVWNDSIIEELIYIKENRKLKPILAHIERYDRSNIKYLEYLHNNEILFQFDTDVFLSFFSKLYASKLIKKGYFDILGSDCHDTVNRNQTYRQAINIIENKFGSDLISRMNFFGKMILKNAQQV